MSGSTDFTKCPRCGTEDALHIDTDWKPHDFVSAICLKCGYEYWTETGLASLEAVNAERAERELEPITELAQPLPEWIRNGYEPTEVGQNVSKAELIKAFQIAMCNTLREDCWRNPKELKFANSIWDKVKQEV